jgi:hypothetical protein
MKSLEFEAVDQTTAFIQLMSRRRIELFQSTGSRGMRSTSLRIPSWNFREAANSAQVRMLAK